MVCAKLTMHHQQIHYSPCIDYFLSDEILEEKKNRPEKKNGYHEFNATHSFFV